MTIVRVIAVAALLLASTARTHPSDLEVDQYEAREPAAEATDQVRMVPKKTQLHPIEAKTQKRSYYPWQGQVIESSPYESLAVWNPPVYQLSRPYYVPIYGAPGRIPIYYPPQPLYLNPGTPQVNPGKKPFKGPPYLPPRGTTSRPSDSTPDIKDRFNNEEDDGPIWPDSSATATTQGSGGAMRPTRRPGRTTTHPPLVHRDHNSISNGTAEQQQQQNNEASFAPALGQRDPSPPPGQHSGPTNCVWAIISCCSTNGEIRYDCFDQRGCPGAFWDNNPCNNDFAKAAIASALNYYNNNR